MAEDNIYKKHVQFNGTNRNSWKYRISVLLDEKYLMDYTTRDITVIVVAASSEEIEVHTKNEKCKSIIVQCVVDSHLEYIQDKETAKGIFDAWKAVFEIKV